MATQPNPPRIAERFFQWFCHQAHLEGLEGDLYELFERNVKQHGLKRARLLYIKNVITLIRSTVVKPITINSKFNTMSVYKNYLKTALRMGWKRKGFSLINLMGLTVGIASVLFISLYLSDELSYDKHVADHEYKYRVYNIYSNSAGVTKNLAIVPPMYSPEFKSNFPQVEKSGRLMLDYGGTMFRVGEQIFSEENGFFAEEEALEILDIRMIHGSLESLNEANVILVSESTFQRFFDDAPFDQQTVLIGSETSIKIGGVYKDIPKQTHIRPGYFVSFQYLMNQVPEERMNSWVWQQFYTYVQLKPGTGTPSFFESVKTFVENTAWPATETHNMKYVPVFQKLTDVHLHSDNLEWDEADRGSYQAVIFLALSAAIILFIACLNFINLTSAQALTRAREVVVRKFVGATRSQLIAQYVTESVLYTLIAGVLSLMLLVFLLPYFNQFTDKAFELSQILLPQHILIFILFVFVLGIISGVYPALLLTSFKPIDVLKGTPAIGMKGGSFKLDLRKVMVGMQYVLTIGLVLISIIMQKQYDHLRNRDMGFNKENLLVLPLTSNMEKDLEQTKKHFSDHSNIMGVTASYGVPGGIVAGDGVILPLNNNQRQSTNVFLVDENFIPLMGMRLVAGRNFSSEIRSDEFQGFIINETAVKNFGFNTPKEALGKPVHWEMWNDTDTLKKGKVIGVVDDFNYKSLHNSVENVVLHIDRTNFSYLIIKIGNGDLSNTLAYLEAQYRAIEPNRLCEFDFVDQSFQEFYESEQRLSQMFSLFTLLAIFTASIGLFGLVTYSIISRGKEIGIRKVMGAGTFTIFCLLVRRYFILLAVSLSIALPMAYYVASGWLDNFAYRIAIDAGIFLLVVALTALMTLLTIGYQAFKGANINPSEKLRAE